MNYLEDTEKGSCVKIAEEYFVVTSDFKSNGNRLLISLSDGSARWFGQSVMADIIEVFTFDKDTNILPIKTNKNAPKNILNQATNIS